MNDNDELRTTPTSSFKEPQFIFALILVFAWLIFIAVAFYLYHGTTATDMNTAVTAVERISAVFGTALGFVWGFYFGTKNSQQVVNQLMIRVREFEKTSR